MRPPPRRMLRELACLRPLHRAPLPVRPGDWLDEHDEPVQTLALFRRKNRRKLTSQRRVLVAQPRGYLAPERRALLRAVARYLRAFFGLAVRIEATVLLEGLPRRARRQGPEGEQLLSTRGRIGACQGPPRDPGARCHPVFRRRALPGLLVSHRQHPPRGEPGCVEH